MKPYKIQVSISLDEDVIAETKLLAEEVDRSFSSYINIVLRRNLVRVKRLKEKQALASQQEE